MTPAALRIDAHAHVFHRGLTLAKGRRYAPDCDAPLADYLRHLDAHGLTHGVLVQPSFLGTDNGYLVACLKAARARLRGVAVVDAHATAQALAALDRAGVAGIRLNLLEQALPDLRAQVWRDLFGRVRALGWHVEIQRAAADAAPLAGALVEQGLRVVVDHYGLPDPALGVNDPGFRALLKLGACGRVHVKLSAPYRCAEGGLAFARQAFPLLRDALGADHLMWGGDWPHTRHEATQTYAGNRAFLDELVSNADERARILAAPRTLFGF